MSHTLVRDIETRSIVDVGDVGVHRYAAHQATQILCVAYCVDDDPVEIWHPGDPVPKAYKAAANGSQWTTVAHNAAFEMAIERGILGPRYGFPVIPVEKQVCTMAAAMAMALPGKLELCAKALGLTERKDKEGRRAMLQTTKPRRARKKENPDELHWYDDKERLGLVDRYCMQDVTIERELFNSLYLLSPEEFQLWLLDQRINNRGFYIDHELALAANKIVQETYPLLNQELSVLTDGVVETVNQVAQMKEWLLQQCGMEVEDLDKETVELLLTNVKDSKAHRLLEIRQLGAHAAVKKLPSFLMRRMPDGRVHGEYQYHAAGTGRWSSRGVQVHNLKRLPEDFDHAAAIKIALKGNRQKMTEAYPNPLATIGLLMRPLIVASPNNELWGADFSGIEARVTAWLAGEESKLDVFRAYDAGKGPDPYIVTAAMIFGVSTDKVTKEQRQIGKACELAFGFQGGVNAYRKFSPAHKDDPAQTISESNWKVAHRRSSASASHAFAEVKNFLSDEEIEKIKKAWRAAHPNIAKYWFALNDAFWGVMHHPGIIHTVKRRVAIVYDRNSFRLPVIWLTLPSGRQLCYPDIKIRRPSLVEKDFGQGRGVYFMDNTQGRWRGVRVYGGLITENVVQAVARDLLADALQRLDAANFKIVTHTHDEVVCEERKGSNRFKQFTEIMNTVPDWASGLPLVAKPWRDERYVK